MPHEMIPIIGIITGGVLLFPVVVGLMIRYLKGHGALPARDQDFTKIQAELQHVRDELAQNRDEMQRLTERQQFVEGLLEKRSDPTALPR